MHISNLKRLIVDVSEGGGGQVKVPVDLFWRLVATALRSKAAFDEDYYVFANSDIEQAVKARTLKSGADHYFITGYLEGRMPNRILVDEKFYLEQNPDVAAAVRRGEVGSAQEHFEFAGFKEGRLPYKDFTLF
ncbi:hypothetical protein [Zavarzinia sp.]|uniref:hypothetical protein n=1 Tax=Zavarzinia sp. TaxID=2027920 RepID=UPI003BB79ED8